MEVKILLFRRVSEDKVEAVKPLLLALRKNAMDHEGYVAGETLVNSSDPEEVLVISTWKNRAAWEAWLADPKRAEIQKEVDQVLGSETLYQAYYHG